MKTFRVESWSRLFRRWEFWVLVDAFDRSHAESQILATGTRRTFRVRKAL